MKALAIIVAGVCVFAGVSLSSAATLHPAPQQAPGRALQVTLLVPHFRGLHAERLILPLQTGGATATTTATATPPSTITPTTGTATPVATITPEPTLSPTGPSYPDPTNILSEMVNKLGLIQTMKFKEVTNGTQPGVETIHVSATGEASCAGPALYGHVNALDVVTGTNQKSTLKYSVIEYNNHYYYKAKQTKNVWKAVKSASGIPAFAPDTGAILFCSAAAGSSSGSGTGGSASQCQIKDLQNLGPAKVSGTSTWNLKATEVCIGTDGSEQDTQLGFQIAQKSHLLLVESYKINDTVDNVILNFKRTRSNFGLKLSIKKPKIGAKTPS
jgi:hypothetical protein